MDDLERVNRAIGPGYRVIVAPARWWRARFHLERRIRDHDDYWWHPQGRYRSPNQAKEAVERLTTKPRKE